MDATSGREIRLVSCVKSKHERAAIPKELYTSTYFEKMRDYAEREHDDWWILSAKHGLLDPGGGLRLNPTTTPSPVPRSQSDGGGPGRCIQSSMRQGY